MAIIILIDALKIESKCQYDSSPNGTMFDLRMRGGLGLVLDPFFFIVTTMLDRSMKFWSS